MKLNILFVYFLIIWLIQGCSTPDHSQFFNEYEASFSNRTNYITHHIQRDTYKIHAREFAKGNSLPTIIMMHGFPDNMHLYDWLVPELMNDRHIITFDFLGWGESDKPDNHLYDFSSLRRDLEAVIDYFKLNTVVLVVHDASGVPGIDWAMDNPNKMAGLVLLNTFYSPMPTLIPPEAIELFSTPGIRRQLSIWATSLSDSIWLQRYNEQMSKFISTEELIEPLQKIVGYQSLPMRNAFYGLNHVLREEVESRKAKISDLKKFKPPVRIIFGNDDPYLNSGVAREFHSLLPDSDLFLVENGGHFVQVDKPKEVAELIRTFPSGE